MGANFLRSMVSACWRDQSAWDQSETAAALAAAAAGAVNTVAAFHDAALTSRDPAVTLRAAAALWALSLAGRLLSVWRLLGLASVAAFSLPVVIDANRHRLHRAWHDADRAVQVLAPLFHHILNCAACMTHLPTCSWRTACCRQALSTAPGVIIYH